MYGFRLKEALVRRAWDGLGFSRDGSSALVCLVSFVGPDTFSSFSRSFCSCCGGNEDRGHRGGETQERWSWELGALGRDRVRARAELVRLLACFALRREGKPTGHPLGSRVRVERLVRRNTRV